MRRAAPRGRSTRRLSRRAAARAALLAAAATAVLAGAPPEPVEPGARLPEGDAAAEHWDLAAHFDTGERLYLRFLITNAGPGEHTALAFGHLLRPGHEPVAFRNGRRRGRWQLSPDGRRLRIGSSRLELGDVRRFEVDNDKREIEIHLDFPDDASAWSAPAAPGGYRTALLNLATPARGGYRLAGMPETRRLAGHALLTHTWFPRAEAELLARRIDVAVLEPAAPLYLSALRTPAGERWRWGVARVAGRLAPLRNLALELTETGDGAHPVPRRLEMRGNGLDGSIELGETLLDVDPLAALPTVLRMVYSFGSRPRHLWVQADADIALKSAAGNAVLRFEHEGIATLAFPDAFPPDEPTRSTPPPR